MWNENLLVLEYGKFQWMGIPSSAVLYRTRDILDTQPDKYKHKNQKLRETSQKSHNKLPENKTLIDCVS